MTALLINKFIELQKQTLKLNLQREVSFHVL